MYRWTNERRRRLADLWEAGLRADRITLIMTGLTEHEVYSQAVQLGLMGWEKKKEPVAHYRIAPATPRQALARPLKSKPKRARKEHVSPLPKLLGRKTGDCEWPADDDYCGAPAFDRKPYCPEHLAESHR